MERRRKFIVQRNKVICAYFLHKRIYPSREWTRSIFTEEQRKIHGLANALLPSLREEYPDLFFNYTRMSGSQFDKLLGLVGAKLQKQKSTFRSPIPASDRLYICLRFLATGTNFADLSYSFRVGKSTVWDIVHETCKVLWNVLGPQFMAAPSCHKEWVEIAEAFSYKWQFPNCVGAIDGKHVQIQAPPLSGSQYICYKGFHSVVLMAVSDAHYCFTYVDAGNFGRVSDGGVFSNCSLGKHLLRDSSFLPPPALLPNSSDILPHVFVADEAFPLKTNLLRPYPGRFLSKEKRTYNYRLSRARRCVENAFGILTARWRVMRTEMQLLPENATMVVLACCCLHNYLIKDELRKAKKQYCPYNYGDTVLENGEIREGVWRQDNPPLYSVIHQGSYNSAATAVEGRSKFEHYFSNEGTVPWQHKYV